MGKLILASASPRRIKIFSDLGIDFDVVPSTAEEKTQQHAPERVVEELSRLKAENVYARTGGTVVAADTVVALDGKIIGKPQSERHAREILLSLSGRSHEVYTGLCVKSIDKCVSCACRTAVWFKDLSEEEISRYIATGEPLDKAGAYGISGFGALFVERIDGDFFNVVGFPISRFGEIMRREFSVEIMPRKAME